MLSARYWFDVTKKLRHARKEAGITQRELSIISGYSQQGISRFEQGHSTSADVLIVYMKHVPHAVDILVNSL